MIALIIMGILTAALSRLKDDQTTAEWVDRAVSTLRENTQVVRRAPLRSVRSWRRTPSSPRLSLTQSWRLARLSSSV